MRPEVITTVVVVEAKNVHEHIARTMYYFSVHLLYASIVGVAVLATVYLKTARRVALLALLAAATPALVHAADWCSGQTARKYC